MPPLDGPHRISSKLQIRLPVRLANQLHIHDGDYFYWRVSDDDPGVLQLIPSEIVERRYSAGERLEVAGREVAAELPLSEVERRLSHEFDGDTDARWFHYANHIEHAAAAIPHNTAQLDRIFTQCVCRPPGVMISIRPGLCCRSVTGSGAILRATSWSTAESGFRPATYGHCTASKMACALDGVEGYAAGREVHDVVDLGCDSGTAGEAGANIKALQNTLGHASAGLTLDRNGHLYGSDVEAVGVAINTLSTRDYEQNVGAVKT